MPTQAAGASTAKRRAKASQLQLGALLVVVQHCVLATKEVARLAVCRELVKAGSACNALLFPNGVPTPTDVEVVLRGRQMQHLHTLGLSGCFKLTDTFFNITPLPLLRRLSLRSCCRLTPQGLAAALRASPLLESLDFGSTSATDATLAMLPQRTPRLADLSLAACYGVTRIATGDIAAAAHLPLLTSLNLSETAVTDAGLASLASWAPALKRLDLSHTTVADTMVLTGCALLEDINLSETCVTDAGVARLAAGAGKRLRKLGVGACGLGDGALQTLSKCCPNLRYLSLARCPRKLGCGVVAALLSGRFAQLRALSLAWCQFAPEGASAAAKSAAAAATRPLPRLRSLFLRGTTGLTDKAIASLAAKPCCPQLTALDLGGESAVSAAAVAAVLAAASPLLATICVRSTAVLAVEAAAKANVRVRYDADFEDEAATTEEEPDSGDEGDGGEGEGEGDGWVQLD